jgi:hypothetical protein
MFIPQPLTNNKGGYKMKLCECNCGDPVKHEKNRFIRGHNLRVNNPMNNPESRKKTSESNKGRPAWNKDKKLSKEHRSNMSKAKKGKTHIEIFGYEGAKKRKKYISEIMMGHEVTEETREKIRRKNSFENGPGWKGGVDKDTWHKHAWRKFGKKYCEFCGLLNSEHKEIHNRRLEMHNTLDPKDYSIMEQHAWMTLCCSCHAKLEKTK